MTENLILSHERVDDIPVLLAQMEKMQVASLIDEHFPTHENWQGLSLGRVTSVWLTFILSEANHRLSHVEPWAAQHLRTLEACLGRPLRALDFSDDRLAAGLDYFSEDTAWENFEGALNQRTLRVYDLKPQCARVDSTTAKGYVQVSEEGLLQFGHSKDGRPDLPQVKINLSVLDPLGLPLTTTVGEAHGLAQDRLQAGAMGHRPRLDVIEPMITLGSYGAHQPPRQLPIAQALAIAVDLAHNLVNGLSHSHLLAKLQDYRQLVHPFRFDPQFRFAHSFLVHTGVERGVYQSRPKFGPAVLKSANQAAEANAIMFLNPHALPEIKRERERVSLLSVFLGLPRWDVLPSKQSVNLYTPSSSPYGSSGDCVRRDCGIPLLSSPR